MAALLAFGVLGAFFIMFPEEFGYHGDKSSSSVKLQNTIGELIVATRKHAMRQMDELILAAEDYQDGLHQQDAATNDFVMKWILTNGRLNFVPAVEIANLKVQLAHLFAEKYGKEKLEERHKELEKRHKENEELRKKIEAGKKEEALNKLRIETLENSKKAP
jgi:hypothetical protein